MRKLIIEKSNKHDDSDKRYNWYFSDDEDVYWYTNNAGNGVFYVNHRTRCYQQSAGTCQFTIAHLKTRRGIENAIKKYMGQK